MYGPAYEPSQGNRLIHGDDIVSDNCDPSAMSNLRLLSCDQPARPIPINYLPQSSSISIERHVERYSIALARMVLPGCERWFDRITIEPEAIP